MPFKRALSALLLLCAACGSAPAANIVPGHPNVLAYDVADRRPMPVFAMPALRPGPAIASASVTGSVAVINFWGSWCGPCRNEEPILAALSKTYGARVKFLGVDERDQKAAGMAFQDEFSVPYPSVFDPSSEMASLFKVHYMPATYVIDAQGRIAGEVIGGITKSSDLTTLLDGLVS